MRGEGPRPTWIYRPGTDLLIALCWVPLWLVGHQLAAGHNDHLLRSAVGAAFLLSFVHQPLTLGLVYGDLPRFRQLRQLFVWAPPVTVAAVVIGVVFHLWILVVIAAVWNTVHTLQQRYGLCRIYARRSGYGSARLDRSVLYTWMLGAVLLVAANPRTLSLVKRVRFDNVNEGGVRLLTDARPVALGLVIPVAVVALGLAAAVVRQELLRWNSESGGANPAKWVYQASSLLLIASIAVDPAAGFIAYVGAHALEYFVVVYKTAESRYGGEKGRSSPLGRVASTPSGRVAWLAAIVGLALLIHAQIHGNAYDITLYSVGALHFLYDGFIWKLRQPVVASDFAIRT
ncbi:MAG TPA: hypothetical protein VF942_01700 [Acidimicrobiales bacterium]